MGREKGGPLSGLRTSRVCTLPAGVDTWDPGQMQLLPRVTLGGGQVLRTLFAVGLLGTYPVTSNFSMA